MEKRICFGSIEEIVLKNGLTMTQTRPECQDCDEFRDCLRHVRQKMKEEKEREELMKQKMITQIIDLSQMISNEMGSCLLEFLNRIYGSPLGAALFRNLILFWEVPNNILASSLTLPIPPSTLALLSTPQPKGAAAAEGADVAQEGVPREGFVIRLLLIQGSFGAHRKANLGLIAHEVARMIASEEPLAHQVLQSLKDSEIKAFWKMEAEQRIDWLAGKLGFRDELGAFRKEKAALGSKGSL